jgi:hypothetical protein
MILIEMNDADFRNYRRRQAARVIQARCSVPLYDDIESRAIDGPSPAISHELRIRRPVLADFDRALAASAVFAYGCGEAVPASRESPPYPASPDQARTRASAFLPGSGRSSSGAIGCALNAALDRLMMHPKERPPQRRTALPDRPPNPRPLDPARRFHCDRVIEIIFPIDNSIPRRHAIVTFDPIQRIKGRTRHHKSMNPIK